MKKIKNSVWKFLNNIGLGGLVQLYLDSALKDYGWFRTFHTKQSVDANGNPLPWYTYPFIAFIRERIQPEFTVFEYGSGNSTLWYARHAAFIVAVEHDKAWFDTVSLKVPDNARIIFREQGEPYIQAIHEIGQRFQIVVVDGRNRVRCALFAADYLTEDGVIILDNSQREHYQPARTALAEKGFRWLDFRGMTPIIGQESTTTVFYRDQNCLGI